MISLEKVKWTEVDWNIMLQTLNQVHWKGFGLIQLREAVGSVDVSQQVNLLWRQVAEVSKHQTEALVRGHSEHTNELWL